MYMHAIFVVQHSELRSFQRKGGGGGVEYEMNDVRFRDDKKNFCDNPLQSVSKRFAILAIARGVWHLTV